MILIIILRQPVDISVTVFSNLTKIDFVFLNKTSQKPTKSLIFLRANIHFYDIMKYWRNIKRAYKNMHRKIDSRNKSNGESTKVKPRMIKRYSRNKIIGVLQAPGCTPKYLG